MRFENYFFLSAQRQHRLKIGRVAIVGALSELPVTQHDLQSFVVDASFALVRFTMCSQNSIQQKCKGN